VPQLLGSGVVGPETRFLMIMNGYGLEERMASWVDPERIFGGMAFICANRGPLGSGEVRNEVQSNRSSKR
jgi:ketopantoate reductase